MAPSALVFTAATIAIAALGYQVLLGERADGIKHVNFSSVLSGLPDEPVLVDDAPTRKWTAMQWTPSSMARMPVTLRARVQESRDFLYFAEGKPFPLRSPRPPAEIETTPAAFFDRVR